MRTLASRKKEQQEQRGTAFFRPRTGSLAPAAADSFFKPRTPQVQRAMEPEMQASSPVNQASSMLVQRQQDGGAAPAQQPAAPQPVAASGGGTPQAQPAAGQSSWTPDVPRIWFDLHDFHKALTQPTEPYLYSSFVHLNRVDNPNFSNNLNPGPVRDTTTVMPGGFRAQPHDLLWFFYTKFFVDSAAAPLPAGYNQFETSADIRFTPAGGGPGFEDHFVDNNARYVAPGGGSSPFILGTTPYGFRAQHNIMQPGTLNWDARLRLSRGNSIPALRIEYNAASNGPDATAFRTHLSGLGIRWRDAAPGEAVTTYRVSFSQVGAGYSCTLEEVAPDGSVRGTRRIEDPSPEVLTQAMALVLALWLDIDLAGHGSYSSQHVEVIGSQRVRFGS